MTPAPNFQSPRASAAATAAVKGHAVVLGASIAGLLAARVLSTRFQWVTVLERDALPEGAQPRKGTPQALQPHGLLARGREVLEQLFPGLTEALLARGATTGDLQRRVLFVADREPLATGDAGHLCLGVSRLALEAELRRRVRALPNVCLREGADVLMPRFDLAAGRVNGVSYRESTSGATQEIAADWVVDCTGRGSHSSRWLAQWGYAAAPEERVDVGLAYVSAYFERTVERTGAAAAPGAGVAAVICAATPQHPLPAALVSQEPAEAGGSPRWVLGVGGYAGNHPVATLQGLRDRAAAIGHPLLQTVAEQARMISPPARYAFPYSLRRHYEKLRRFPQGFLVMGDAQTSFNPVFGQGMTVAACEALALDEAFVGGEVALAQRFFKACARVVDVPWQLAVGADLALPQVKGPRPLSVRLVNAYVARLRTVARQDAEVAGAFLKVVHLVAPPASLFAPRTLWRVLQGPRAAAARQGRQQPQAEGALEASHA